MRYKGKYRVFDASRIKTYPLLSRKNRVKLENILLPGALDTLNLDLPAETCGGIEEIASAIVSARRAGKPVILFTGAHLIKNGCGALLVDLVRRHLLTLVAGNVATAIHDFELALIGETSEDVPDALSKGQFGMAHEFAYMNGSLRIGNERGLGFGESLGRMICDHAFRDLVLASAANQASPKEFCHTAISILAACFACDVPCTIHAGIGTDVIDQHPSFDGEAKGGCSGRDFLIYVDEVSRLTDGGVVLNIGSAVTGPEVLLKAVSMAGNIGRSPREILCADFDLREHLPAQVSNESAQGYYFRDQKSVWSRIPKAFSGRGLYIQGDQRQTFPFLCQSIIKQVAV